MFVTNVDSRVPGKTDKGVVVDAYTEHVSILPTLAQAAAGVQVPPCPAVDSAKTPLCTEV